MKSIAPEKGSAFFLEVRLFLIELRNYCATLSVLKKELSFAGSCSDVLVIIPTYNESENITRVIERVFMLYPNGLDILVIDDNSPDGTADMVMTLQQAHEGLYLMRRSCKQGLGTAYLAGFRFALQENYRYIIEMDADFSHDPEMISSLLGGMNGADLVIGSRYLHNTVNVVNWPLSRLILSKMASIYTRMITGMPVFDPTSGFKCFSLEVLKGLDLDRVNSEGYSFQIEMNFRAWKKGFVIHEVPIVFTDRTVGKSKMTKKNIREAVWIVWLLKIKSIAGVL
ncbi:MAG: polyprenol monophosphomannose synthase [Chlorobium sp.]|nr:polyprenol monophosphomannose synthase [Chlorobiaceae bacterium]MCF8215787.1 polyprenol monophosphomannose synthase [Chlorobium sp.]MCF8270617.1 polyprenol monophosphomannose synthase [Chlorobium sp.]MCF8286997.1 polyprenol monophosphomannose synthase [Chlorobium sp.]MCF8290654.1 polyprenol monophosphomannose synthase [Chlorobium sp.]